MVGTVKAGAPAVLLAAVLLEPQPATTTPTARTTAAATNLDSNGRFMWPTPGGPKPLLGQRCQRTVAPRAFEQVPLGQLIAAAAEAEVLN